MTFFGQEKKNLHENLKHSLSVGPGTYSLSKEKSNGQSYAPFGSLIKKESAVKNGIKQVVGPGSYNISRDIIRPSIQQYQNQNCIIIKINEQGNSQFKSKLERFNQLNSSDTPGPGSYSYFEASKPAHRNRTHSVGSTFNKMKQLYINQYKQKRKPTLLSDKPEPPEEEPKTKEVAKGVVRWDLNKRQRFHTEPKQYLKEEDKSIILDRASIEKKKEKLEKKQSSFFASKSVKSSFDELIYKSKNPFKVEIRKMLGFQDELPGPGSYNCNQVNIKPEKKPQKFQFFGSTANRFERNENQDSGVGPGDYQLLSGTKIQKPVKSRRLKTRAHRSKALTEPDQQAEVGPGSYNVQTAQCAKKQSFNLKYNRGIAEFGSNKPRFEKDQEARQEPKSEYISFMAQQDEERKKKIEEEFNLRRNVLKNKQHSVFVSESKRNCFPETEIGKNQPFGTYEVGIEDISTRIKKKKELIQQFAECNLTKPGFQSAVERFKTEKEEEPTHKDCWCQIKEVEKKNIQHMSPAFQSNSLRTEVFEMKVKGPAVGSYTKQSSFVKDSFNSRFIKQNKNKTRKIKIWKTQK